MNLATRWNPLYWQCACLCVNAGNYVDGSVEDNDDTDENSEENAVISTDQKEKRVAPNYEKIGRAIAEAQFNGVQIELPYINEAQIDFVPDIQNNKIMYSLRAISCVGDDLLGRILEQREIKPFESLQDFLDRVPITQVPMIGLIKAGCFDKIMNVKREEIMNQYLQILADKEIPLKDKLTTVQLRKALEEGYTAPPEHMVAIRVFKYKQYIDKHQKDAETKRYILTIPECIKFFHQFIEDKMNLQKGDYSFLSGDNIAMKMSSFKKVYDEYLEDILAEFNSLEGRQRYQRLLQDNFINALREKYCLGSLSKWEMDMLTCYHDTHELLGVNFSEFGVKDFNKLTDNEPGVIAGTVIGSNNMKHTVTLLTTQEVVDVKFFGTMYGIYNKIISEIDPTSKEKHVIDDTWFKRGNKLLVYGYRKETNFVCKAQYVQPYGKRGVGLISSIKPDHTATVRWTKKKGGNSNG